MSQPNRTCRDRARRDLTKQLAIDSSSNSSRESDETFSTTTTSSSRVTGPTTRRAWSDWVGGTNGLATVSRSFSEGEAQPITNGTGRGGRILPTRQRQNKKLRRKASEAEEPEEPKLPAPRRRAAARGRVKKPKTKKTIKINGLDLLHSETLLSTSPQGNFCLLFYLFPLNTDSRFFFLFSMFSNRKETAACSWLCRPTTDLPYSARNYRPFRTGYSASASWHSLCTANFIGSLSRTVFEICWDDERSEL